MLFFAFGFEADLFFKVMLNKIVLFALMFVSLSTFAQKRYFYDDLNIVNDVYYSKIDNKPVTGIIYYNHFNGKIAYERKCKNGLLDGKSTDYHYNGGKIAVKGQHKNGKMDGTFKYYSFETGRIYLEIDFKDGREIIRRCYDDSGFRKSCD